MTARMFQNVVTEQLCRVKPVSEKVGAAPKRPSTQRQLVPPGLREDQHRVAQTQTSSVLGFLKVQYSAPTPVQQPRKINYAKISRKQTSSDVEEMDGALQQHGLIRDQIQKKSPETTGSKNNSEGFHQHPCLLFFVYLFNLKSGQLMDFNVGCDFGSPPS